MVKVHDQDARNSSGLFISLIMEPANGWFELNRVRIEIITTKHKVLGVASCNHAKYFF